MTDTKKSKNNPQTFTDIFKDKSVVSVVIATLILLLISFFAFRYLGNGANAPEGELNGNGVSSIGEKDNKDNGDKDGKNEKDTSIKKDGEVTDKKQEASSDTKLSTNNNGSVWVANDYDLNEFKDKDAKYTVVNGDTLWEIAEAYYGNGAEWTKIASANNVSYLSNGNPLIITGQVLTIP